MTLLFYVAIKLINNKFLKAVVSLKANERMTVKIIRFPAPVSRLGYYGHICSYHIYFAVQYEFSIDDSAIRKQQFRCNYINSKISLELAWRV